jgi:hypothetical protein
MSITIQWPPGRPRKAAADPALSGRRRAGACRNRACPRALPYPAPGPTASPVAYPTLRAHATSDEAKALVARLAARVDEHAHAVGLRKHKRNKTAERLQYWSED